MKRAILIHGWEGSPNRGWIPWLKNELESRGFHVEALSMPNPAHPKMAEWVHSLENEAPDKETILVGHSLGCITILRYLEHTSVQVAGAVFVAGFSDNLGYSELKSFFSSPIDWEKARQNCRRFVAINSDDDPFVPLKHGEIFKEKLGAELVVIPGAKHFSADDNCISLPEALEATIQFSSK